MNPRDFCELACRLADNQNAADSRTVISRAYFAAYNVGVCFAERFGVEVPPKKGSHQLVVGCLSNTGDSRIDLTGQHLGDLAGMRVKADYRMTDTGVERSQTAKLWIERAKRIIAILDEALSDPARCPRIHGEIMKWSMTTGRP